MLQVHLFDVPTWLNIAFCSATTVLVLCLGTWRERLLCLGWSFPPISSSCTVWYVPRSEGLCFAGSPNPVLWLWLIDNVMLLSLIVFLVRRADRYPIIWAGSFMLLSFLSDAFMALVPGIGAWTLTNATIIWWYLVGAMLIWGSIGASSTRSVTDRVLANAPSSPDHALAP